MKPSVARLFVLTALVAFTAAPLAWADTPVDSKNPKDKKSGAGKFLRIRRDAKEQPVALETAVVRYVPASGEGGVEVDLVSAVHIGEKAYYDKLNELFDRYDVVLYELVAPEGTRIPRGGKRETSNPLAFIQQMSKHVLDLESQVEQVDYTKKHFVHADLSPEKMGEAMRKRGEDGLTVMLGVIADMLRQQNLQAERARDKSDQEGELDIFSLFTDPQGSTKMKRMLAEQFAAMESPGAGLGQTLTNILVVDRNEAALKVLQKELAKGRKKIAIFYGAAHMPDFEKHLKDDFDLKRRSEEWLTAWDLTKKSKGNGLDDLFKGNGLGELLKRLGQ
jgi:hypothetical protein